MSGFCHTRERTDKPLRSTVSKSRYAAHTDRLSGVHTPRPSLVRVPEWSRIQPLTAMWMCPVISSQTCNRAVSSLTVTTEWFDFRFRADFKRRVILRYHDLTVVDRARSPSLAYRDWECLRRLKRGSSAGCGEGMSGRQPEPYMSRDATTRDENRMVPAGRVPVVR